MSGIEIVGLILGITPLIISAIEDYRAGLEPFKIWARYRKELKNLKMVLDLETAKLLNTCEMLLETVVSQSELAQLLREPNGPLWSDQSLHQKLEDTLGRSYAPFFSCLLEFDDALSELQEKLDKNRTSHVSFQPGPDSRLQFLTSILVGRETELSGSAISSD